MKVRKYVFTSKPSKAVIWDLQNYLENKIIERKGLNTKSCGVTKNEGTLK